MIDSRMIELARAIVELGDAAAVPELAEELAEAVMAEAVAETEATMRYALVKVDVGKVEQLKAYMPGNYEVVGRTPIGGSNTVSVLIAGRDVAGWTLDGYVIPRLASGMYYAEEIG